MARAEVRGRRPWAGGRCCGSSVLCKSRAAHRSLLAPQPTGLDWPPTRSVRATKQRPDQIRQRPIRRGAIGCRTSERASNLLHPNIEVQLPHSLLPVQLSARTHRAKDTGAHVQMEWILSITNESLSAAAAATLATTIFFFSQGGDALFRPKPLCAGRLQMSSEKVRASFSSWPPSLERRDATRLDGSISAAGAK